MKLSQIVDRKVLDSRQRARTYEFYIALVKARSQRKSSTQKIWRLENLNDMESRAFTHNWTLIACLEEYPQLKIKAERMINAKKAYEGF